MDREILLRFLSYEADSGVFRWAIAHPSCKIFPGAIAGHIGSQGYRQITVRGKTYMAHRLVWLVETGAMPKGELDHINGVRDDNRIVNLRSATKSQNIANSKVRKDNSSGFKGVQWDNEACLWRARISVNGRRIHLGRFNSLERAHVAYCRAAQRHFGEFANSGGPPSSQTCD
jgi:HNH endonuclease